MPPRRAAAIKADVANTTVKPPPKAKAAPKKASAKRPRTPSEDELEEEDEPEEEEEEEVKVPAKRKAKAKQPAKKTTKAKVAASDDEMGVDEDADEEDEKPAKAKGKAKQPAKSKAKPKPKPGAKAGSDAEGDEEEEEPEVKKDPKMVKVVVRGGAPVDPSSGLVGELNRDLLLHLPDSVDHLATHQVYSDGSEIYDAMLNQVCYMTVHCFPLFSSWLTRPFRRPGPQTNVTDNNNKCGFLCCTPHVAAFLNLIFP